METRDPSVFAVGAALAALLGCLVLRDRQTPAGPQVSLTRSYAITASAAPKRRLRSITQSSQSRAARFAELQTIPDEQETLPSSVAPDDQMSAPSAAQATKTPKQAAPKEILVNQKPVQFSSAQPVMVNGRLMVPIQTLIQQAGGTVNWDSDSHTLEIDMPNQRPLTLSMADDEPDDQLTAAERAAGTYQVWSRYSDMLSNMNPDQFLNVDGYAYMPLDRLLAPFNGSDAWDSGDQTLTINIPDSN